MKFYENIADYYDFIFPFNEAHEKFILSSLNKRTKQSNLLDIGCGTGNLSIKLSKSFKNITAIDLDTEMINRAKDKSTQHKNINFVKINMLKVAERYPDNYFDTVISFGNTIVHLTNTELINIFFKNIRKILKVSQPFLFQIINYDRILNKNIKGLSTIENEHIKFERNYNYIEDKHIIEFSTSLTIKQTGKVLDNMVNLYPLRKEEIKNLLNKNGFKHINFFGNFNRDKLTIDSVPLIVEAI